MGGCGSRIPGAYAAPVADVTGTLDICMKIQRGMYESGSESGSDIENAIGIGNEVGEEQIPVIAERQASRTTSSGSKVLVVDDNRVVNEEMCDHVRSAGYEPVSAQDGAEALSLFRANQDEIRCVMMDLFMPRMDGFRATATILEAAGEESPPVFGMMSGPRPRDVERRCYDLGFTRVIQKPSSPGQIACLVEG